MTKAEIIAGICEINKGAKAERLQAFPVEQLTTYLDHLIHMELQPAEDKDAQGQQAQPEQHGE